MLLPLLPKDDDSFLHFGIKEGEQNVSKTVAKTPQRFGSGFRTNGRIINDNDNESLKWQFRLNISTTKARSLAQFFENLPNSH